MSGFVKMENMWMNTGKGDSGKGKRKESEKKKIGQQLRTVFMKEHLEIFCTT